MNIRRCHLLGQLRTIWLGAALAATALLALTPEDAIAQKGPLKIGVILPLTGVFAPNGQDALDGFQLYIDEIGGHVAGRKIELIVEDAQGKPDVGLTKARKLVEADRVHVLTGVVSTGVALAVQGYVREKKIPLVISADAGANQITMPGKLLNPYIFRVSQNSRTPGAVAADWAYKQGWRKVSMVTSDYAGGMEVAGGFVRVFCARGGQVVQDQYPPLGNPDFSPYIANLQKNVDGVVIFTPGADGLRLARQYIEAGLKDKIPYMDVFGQTSFEPNLPQLGDSGLGILSSLHYTAALKTPENERFVKAFRAKTGRLPTDNGPDGYAGARAIVEAAKAVSGNVEDTDKFMAALARVRFPSPKGDIALDEYHQVIQSMYIRKVEKVGSDYLNVPIASYTKIDQFWPYTAKEYMAFKHEDTQLKGKMTDCAKWLEK